MQSLGDFDFLDVKKSSRQALTIFTVESIMINAIASAVVPVFTSFWADLFALLLAVAKFFGW